MAGAASPLRFILAAAFFLLLTSFFLLPPATAAPPPEADVLLHFKTTISGADAALPSWSPAAPPPCVAGAGAGSKWAGVICDAAGAVYGLQLENMNLVGTLDLGPLADLRGLRTLSFTGNNLSGGFPSVGKLGALKSIYLSRNRFSGEIPDSAFAGMGSMKKVFLSGNNFSGEIPGSLAELPRLLELRIDGNVFSGGIPEFRMSPELKTVDVSGNDLSGPVPESLRKMDAGFFAGNKALCGLPLKQPCPPAPALPPSSTQPAAETPPPPPNGTAPPPHPKNHVTLIVAVIVIVLLVAAMAAAKSLRQKSSPVTKKKTPEPLAADKAEQGLQSSRHFLPASAAKPSKVVSASGAGEQRGGGKLVFVREGGERFEMQDLLKASAEVLGSGGLGSSYKASLGSSTDGGVAAAVVVKRYREMNGVGKEEFCEHMRRLGRLSHPNLLPLIAYYYRKEEKLLVSGFVVNGSLAHLLHGNRAVAVPPAPALDWSARLKIAKGVAAGLSYLHDELPATIALPHGHLKSSNVLLDADLNAVLADYALSPTINPAHAARSMAAHRSPELGRKSDVWCLGVLVLELLTGRFPAAGGEEDLVMWAAAAEEEVFDGEMGGMAGSEEEMKKLLKIGLWCCERDADKRPAMSAAAEEIRGVAEPATGAGDACEHLLLLWRSKGCWICWCRRWRTVGSKVIVAESPRRRSSSP